MPIPPVTVWLFHQFECWSQATGEILTINAMPQQSFLGRKGESFKELPHSLLLGQTMGLDIGAKSAVITYKSQREPYLENRIGRGDIENEHKSKKGSRVNHTQLSR